MDIAVTGSSGFLGSALTAALTARGDHVVRLVRPGSTGSAGFVGGADTIRWDPSAGTIDAASLEGIGAVVNLAGRAIAPQPWTRAYKAEVLGSRVKATTLIATTLAGLQRPPSVLVSASASGYYGNRGNEILTEQSGPGTGFLAEVCQQWEAAAAPATEAGIRVAFTRTGIVLSPQGGALGRMLQFFKMGLGGKIGAGTQWWSWIALEDEIGAFLHLLDGEASGPFNLCAPHPVTNGELTASLAAALHRPAVLTVPKLALRAFGEFADEMLLASQRMAPTRLEETGYLFRSVDLLPALTALLGR
ncbi:MAG TPA: TIGR01777 family oxidoreductase [Actinomycetota bacterium]|nr:TIGR01777 family oxidoreductase [Actinomycetota bacterium]